jgi:hypothetical protein
VGDSAARDRGTEKPGFEADPPGAVCQRKSETKKSEQNKAALVELT